MGFSFEEVKDLIKKRLSLTAEWADILFFGNNERLVDAIAFGIDKLANYNEYLLRESKWELAKNRTSLLYQSPYLSYIPKRRTGATGFIEVSTDSGFAAPWAGAPFVIPEWSQFTVDDIQVFTTSDITFSSSDGNSKTLAVVQGIVREFDYTAVGSINEEITVDNDSVENTNIKVYKVVAGNETEIEIVDSLYKVKDSEVLVCELENKYDYSQVVLRFGDNLNGRALNSGEVIRVRYGETLGDEGNILITDEATVDFTVLDTLSNPIPLYARTNDFVDGGRDIESVEEIRLNAPNLFQTGYRAGNRQDWITLLNESVLIGKASVYGEYELKRDILQDKTEAQAIVDGDLTATGRVPDANNLVFITALDPSGGILTDTEKDAIVHDYLHGYGEDFDAVVSPTTMVTWADPEIIDLRVIANVTINTDQDSNTMTSTIKESLDEEYDVLNRDFFEHLYKSQFDGFIQNITGVYKHNTETYIRDIRFEKVSTSNQVVHIGFIFDESITIRVRRKIADVWGSWEIAGVDVPAIDELTGTITALNQYAIDTDSIDYRDGIVNFRFLGDGLTHILNGEFTTDLSEWAVDTAVNPLNTLVERIDSNDLLQASTTTDLVLDKAGDEYCIEVKGNTGGSTDPNDRWVAQELDLVAGDQYRVELICYTPSTNVVSNGDVARIAIGSAKGLFDVADSGALTNTEDIWRKETLTFTAGADNWLNLFSNSATVDDVVYYDKIIIKHIADPTGETPASSTYWGVQNPGDTDTDGYLIEVAFQTREDRDIILNQRYQIINLEEDNIEVNISFKEDD
jgi:hypothetical protein